jgi:uncharacterized protein involved in tolerance to divalent cations
VFSWFFWPLDAMLFIGFVAGVGAAEKENEKSNFSTLLLVAALAVCAAHWNLGHRFLSWKFDLALVGAYVGVGFITMMYKWGGCLATFREVAVGITESTDRLSAIQNALPWQRHSYVADDRVLLDNSVTPPRYMLNWKIFPIFSWWFDWPYYIFSVIVDPIKRFIRAAIRWLKDFFTWTARLASVK